MRISYEDRKAAERVRGSAVDAGQDWAVALCDRVIDAYWGRWRVGQSTVDGLRMLADDLGVA